MTLPITAARLPSPPAARRPAHWLAALAVLLAPLPAAAHAILVESSPKAGSHVAPGPQDVRLRFNSRIDAARSKLELAPRAAAGGAATPQPGTRLPIRGGASHDLLLGSMTPAAGEWVLRWQVLAVDGHITRGIVPFTVDPAAPAPAPAPAAAIGAPAGPPAPSPAPKP